MAFFNVSQQAGYIWYNKKWATVDATGVQALGAGEGVTIPIQSHTLYVCGYGEAGETTSVAPTSWQIELQASIDNLNWFTILTHTTADGIGNPVYVNSLQSVLYYIRGNVTALTLGSCDHLNIHWIGVTK